jgi:predicted ferric reductase
MSREEILNRLNLFEALVFGIYGGWLISFVDKISFLKYPAAFNIFSWGFQIACVALSFSTLLILFGYSIFRPNFLTRWLAFILGIGHEVGNYGALWAETWTMQLLVFFLIGTILFFIIYAIELRRTRITRGDSHGQE